MSSRAGAAIRVLVADDSALFREALKGLVLAEPGFEVVAVAADGDQAAEAARRLRPDVVTMDLHMPDADGFSGIARIMAETPTPILVLAASPTESAGFKALSLGALDILGKPGPAEDLARYGSLLRSRLKLLAGVKVIRHPRGLRAGSRAAARVPVGKRELVVVGASLGGPRALAQILRALPADLPVPVAVVQHIAEGFAEGLASWLDQETPLEVRAAADRDVLKPGRVLVAPSGRHLVVADGYVRLTEDPPVETFRPSVNPLFASAARVYGPRACGVLLTGMGRDGAIGLKALRDAGGFTLAQDEASSAVFGMARAAIEAGAVDRVLPLDEIPGALVELVR
jgi:two-component system chemotaxis response regulator CheB